MNSWNSKVDKSIWNPSNCRSWYQDKNGRPWAMWPDTVWKYFKATSNINPKEHFLYEHPTVVKGAQDHSDKKHFDLETKKKITEEKPMAPNQHSMKLRKRR